MYNNQNNQQLNNTYAYMDERPLTNGKYEACQDNHEQLTENRLDEILKAWSTTNFWLGCIGAVFLIILISIIIGIVFIFHLGNEINNIFTAFSWIYGR